MIFRLNQQNLSLDMHKKYFYLSNLQGYFGIEK